MSVDHLRGNVHAIIEYWAAGDVVCSPPGNVYKVGKTRSNGEAYLAVQSAWFLTFVTEAPNAVQNCFLKQVELEGELVLMGHLTIQLQSRDADQ